MDQLFLSYHAFRSTFWGWTRRLQWRAKTLGVKRMRYPPLAGTVATTVAALFVGRAGAQVASTPLPRASVVIGDVRVFDGERTLEHRYVSVAAGKILAVDSMPPTVLPSDTVDGRGLTLLPGLIDSHVHLGRDAVAGLEESLAFGVTTVLDMGENERITKVLLKLRTTGLPAGADVRYAGVPATAPSGHMSDIDGERVPTVSSQRDADSFVQARLAEGSDFIKIVRDDLGWLPGDARVPTLDSATVAAVVAAAHAVRRLAIVHAGSERDADIALGAGADGLAHLFVGTSVSPAFGAFVVRSKAFVIPTLSSLYAYCGVANAQELAADSLLAVLIAPQVREALELRWHIDGLSCVATRDALHQLVAAGTLILVGTDAPAPGTAFGASVHGELSLLVRGGLAPSRALEAATSSAAVAFHLNDRGFVRPGLRADLLLVAGDPTKDITATRRICEIWKEGHRVPQSRVNCRLLRCRCTR